MKICKLCGNEFNLRILIEGKERNLCKRKYCLVCSPFKSHNTRDLSEVKFDKIAYWKDPSIKERHNHNTRDRRAQYKKRAVDYMGGECQICGYRKSMTSLVFHHIDPSNKLFGISYKGLIKEWDIVKTELDKCVLLCSNCHSEVHAGITNLPV